MKFTALHFEKSTLKGKVFRSDSGELISNSYILLASEKDQESHFDTRTDEAGNYIFGHIPAGRYTVSIYAWFGKRDEVPCQNPLNQKTADGGDIAVEWQWKSQAFMEIVMLKGFFYRIGAGECQRLRCGGQVTYTKWPIDAVPVHHMDFKFSSFRVRNSGIGKKFSTSNWFPGV